MNCRMIQRALMLAKYHKAVVMPNFTPLKWWECDVLELTKAGYFREYEIKMSLSDFRADKAKERTRHIWKAWPEQSEVVTTNKHLELKIGNPNGPRQFWFVAPVGLIPENEIPKWAGFIGATFRPGPKPYAVLSEIKPAPMLHKIKISDTVKEDIYRTCYFRFQHHLLFGNVSEESAQLQNPSQIVTPNPLRS